MCNTVLHTMNILVIFLLGFLFELHAAPLQDDENLIVTLPNGKVLGAIYQTSSFVANNITFYGWQGIPFAKPPVGELRFESPKPADSWEGIRNATADAKNCVSNTYLDHPETESEDCLYVNVYAPRLKPKDKLPVMFWIYGGSFKFGSSQKSLYGPDFLIEKDVIVVSFNYRVGPFGFLSTGDEVISGNWGLKDQHLALKWTNENIEYFGGDSKKITIFGQSAGGASTGLHLLSDKSKGLFRAAIVESGSALNFWTADTHALETAFQVSSKIPGGNYGNNTTALKNFLKNQTAENIMKAFGELPFETQCWPVIEPESEDAFITGSHYERLLSGNFSQVPIMIGIAAEESTMLLENKDYVKSLALNADTSPRFLIARNIYPNSTDEKAIIKKIKDMYLNEKSVKEFSTHLAAFIKYSSDIMISTAVIKHAELASNYVPVYFYQYAYYGRPIVPPFIDGVEKATHSAEVPFLFHMTGISDTNNPMDILTQERTVTLWTNFAKFLNPTPEKSELFDNMTWPKFNNKDYPYLNINDTLEVRTHIKGDTYTGWNNIYETYGKKPFVTF